MTLASFLEAYRAGLFPMAEPNGPVLWYRPVRRAVLPLDEASGCRQPATGGSQSAL